EDLLKRRPNLETGAAMSSVTKAKPIAAKMRSVRIGVIFHPQNCIAYFQATSTFQFNPLHLISPWIGGILVICPGARRSPTTTRMVGRSIFILGWDEVAPISDGRGPGLPGAWRKTRRRAELSAFITCVNVRRFI